ncbi:MAG: MFS transporter [Acidobacteria bacterium]|nr:MFS transporter [Acidobacteriota bacterium]
MNLNGRDSSSGLVNHESTLEHSTLRAVSRRLIPFLFVLYVVSFLDRVNVGFAALQMNHDLGLSPAVYGFGGGIFFIGYSIFEVPSNLILARTGARLWIARIMVTWGLIAAGMMFVQGPLSFYVLRFLLGIAEAGFFPGIIFYLSGWYPNEARARAIARFMTAIPASGIIGGPVSGALLGLDGWLDLKGWQWLFLLEGLPAVLLGVAVWRFLPDRPENAAWLRPEQRKWLTDRLSVERNQCLERHSFSVTQALSNPIVWQLGLLIFLSASFGQYALSLWLPQIVRGFSGLTNLQVGFVSAIPSLAAMIAMVMVAAHSDRTGERCLHIAAVSAVAALGFLGCALVQGPILTVLFLTIANAALLSSHGPFWPLPSKFLSGAAAAGGIGLINSLGNLSGFAGPYAIGLLNNASGNFQTGFLLLALVPLAGMILALRLRNVPVLKNAP